jgi:hypothetical protein
MGADPSRSKTGGDHPERSKAGFISAGQNAAMA